MYNLYSYEAKLPKTGRIGGEATMAQEQIYCPACRKGFTKRGLRLHFRQALTGLDPIWDSRKPHTGWARSKGLEVTDEGYTFNFEKLNEILDRYLTSQ